MIRSRIKRAVSIFGPAIVALIIISAVVCLFVRAGTYNAARSDLCAKHGMVKVKEAPFGSYGCAKIIPFDELEDLPVDSE